MSRSTAPIDAPFSLSGADVGTGVRETSLVIAAENPQAVRTTADQNRQHWPALDGLRGSAILAVMTCHYASLLPHDSPIAGVLTFGWAGVDLFFVLSGFLITGILIDAKGDGRYFRNFYARRALRIFPLYFGLLLAILVVLLVLDHVPLGPIASVPSGSDQDIRLLWSYQPWLWTYTMNFRFAFQMDWGPWVDSVAPLWSLSVEEQFYLVWPLIVFCASRRTLLRICLGILVVVPAVRLAMTAGGVHFFAVYVLTFTRADALAAGGLLALLLRRPEGVRLVRRLTPYTGAAAGILLLFSLRGFDPLNYPFLRDMLYTALAISFATLIAWSIDPAAMWGIPNRFYNQRLLRRIGTYSYGLYVFHVPVINLTRESAMALGYFTPAAEQWGPSLALIGVNLVLTFALAIASFHLYEARFLRLKRFFVPRPASSPAKVAAA